MTSFWRLATPTESDLDALFSSSLVALRLSRLSISQKGCCRSGALAALLSQREGALDPEQSFHLHLGCGPSGFGG